MKTSNDPRHLKRVLTLKTLFSLSFPNGKGSSNKLLTSNILEHKQKIDDLITMAAPEYPVEKISKIDVAILRLAIWELVFDKKNPYKVIIDEAVELAKEYGSDNSSSFINGVLGTIYKKINE